MKTVALLINLHTPEVGVPVMSRIIIMCLSCSKTTPHVVVPHVVLFSMSNNSHYSVDYINIMI